MTKEQYTLLAEIEDYLGIRCRAKTEIGIKRFIKKHITELQDSLAEYAGCISDSEKY